MGAGFSNGLSDAAICTVGAKQFHFFLKSRPIHTSDNITDFLAQRRALLQAHKAKKIRALENVSTRERHKFDPDRSVCASSLRRRLDYLA